MLEEGKKLQDRYRIEKQIGQGGMGSVYRATDERFNSTVAIKETLFTDDNYRKAFSREARLLNSLKHTALPKVSDTFIDGNGQYIVMEYISGEDLFEMLEESGDAFPLEDVLIWAEQLLDALEYLHGQTNPVIHRDIKPQNLKLTPQGQVILLDFGLAKGNPTDANHKTAANSIFGYSRNYASLEQIQGTGTDPRSDIYSLAATLYHLVTGKPPADALTRVMMVLNEEDDPLQPANLIHEQVSEEVASNLQKALSLNANLRPQTAGQMRELLSGKQKTTVSTRPNTESNKATGTNLYTQNTKVFVEAEENEIDSKQSEIKTEVLAGSAPASDSVRTKFAKPKTLSDKNGNTQNSRVITQAKTSNKNLFALAVIGIFLFVGSVASMVYIWGPTNVEGGTDISPETQSAIANTTNVENSNTETNSDNSNVFTAEDSNSNTLFPMEDLDIPNENEVVADKQESAPKQTNPVKENTKSAGKNTESKAKNVTKITNGKVITEDATISNGRVETKDVIIDENGITEKNRIRAKTKLPPNSPITKEQYESLTPDQQRKVRDALEMKRRADEQRMRNERERQRRIERRLPPPPRPPGS